MKPGTTLGLIALALAAGTVVYWFYLTGQVNLPDNRTWFVIAFLLAAALGVAAYVKGTSIPGGIPPFIAILIGLFMPFTIYISPQTTDAAKLIKVGDTLPHFTALDDKGVTFDSKELDGQLVLIKFFRGHW